MLDEEVDQRLHGLHLLVGDQLVVLGHRHEVDKAHVEDVMLVDVPEWAQPVGVVQVCIAAEHLLHDALAVLVESLRESAGLANPLIGRCVVAIGVGAIRRSRRYTSSCVGILDCGGLRGAGHLLGREHNRVVDLADNPLLHPVDELGSGDLSCATINKPGVGQPRASISPYSEIGAQIPRNMSLTAQQTLSDMCSHCRSDNRSGR